MTIYGAVICVVGDIPASNFIGGFKEGVGFSLRKCRKCLATKSDICLKVHVHVQKKVQNMYMYLLAQVYI